MISFKMLMSGFLAFLATPFIAVASFLVNRGADLQESAKADVERDGF